MFSFWIIAAVLTIIALAFIVLPLLKKTVSTTSVERNTLNIAIYRERLAELAQEDLTPPQLAQAQQELEKTLSQDLEEQAQLRPAVARSKARWISVMLVIILVPLIAIGGYLRLGQPQLLNTESNSTKDPQMASIEIMVTKLKQRLANEPNNLTDWYMLARTLAVLERFPEAHEAFTKALSLGGDTDPEILVSFAESLGKTNDGELKGLPSLLLERALQVDPNNQQALWIYGFAAMQVQAYSQAVERWQRLLDQIPMEETKVRQTLIDAIAQAQQLAQVPVMTEAVAESITTESTTVTNTTNTQIQVHVTVDSQLQDKLQPTDTVFIYAKASQGPTMPLAVIKKTVNELPLTVTLDDTMAMTPTMTLSHFAQVTVAARISHSGSAMTESGDLLGQIEDVDLAKTNAVDVVINQIVP